MRVSPITALVLLATVACAGSRSTRGVHPASLQQAASSVAVAFNSLQIPVAVFDDMTGIVASGGFVLEHVWGGVPIDQRIDCGVMHDGTPRARQGPVRMSIQARLRASNDRLATARAGASIARRPTEVQLNAQGEVKIEDETYGCGLTEEFSHRVLATAGVQDRHEFAPTDRVRSVADRSQD